MSVTTSQGDLSRQIRAIHDGLRETAPSITRVACALYEPKDDLLKTFINSTIDGVALRGYQYKLSDSMSLSELARTHAPRLLADLPHQLDPDTTHSAYVLGEGYVSSFTVPMVHRGEFTGFVFFDSREPDAFTTPVQRELMLLASLIAMAVANELTAISSVTSTIQIARDFTQLRDHETAAHMDRMARYSRVIARDTATHFGLSDEQVEHLMLYAPMHDIGKIGIPDLILLKPGRLEPDEWAVMQSHTLKGAAMVDSILRDLQQIDVPDEQVLRNIVELHHEKLDGSGYPRGLRGDAVPPEARIVAVADIFDALTTHRPYKATWTFQDSFAELQRMADAGKIDAFCVQAVIAARDEIVEILASFPDS